MPASATLPPVAEEAAIAAERATPTPGATRPQSVGRRIYDHAQGGEILASTVVRELAAGKGFLFADTGEVTLKGFEKPVRLFAVRWRE